MKRVEWRWSTESARWQTGKGWEATKRPATLYADGNEYQKMHGFGACFNELGYKALLQLNVEEQETLLRELFAPEKEGCNINFCRLPIGANDYSLSWYSLDETAGDYELSNFSLKRDEQALIPFVKRAMKYAPDLRLFASPWSPPHLDEKPAGLQLGQANLGRSELVRLCAIFCKVRGRLRSTGNSNRPSARAERAGGKPKVPLLHVDGYRTARFHSGLAWPSVPPCRAGY